MFGQIREAYKVTKAEKPWIGAAMAFIFLAGFSFTTLGITSYSTLLLTPYVVGPYFGTWIFGM